MNEKKLYTYIRNLQTAILSNRLQDREKGVRMDRKVTLLTNDPRSIQRNIASVSPKPVNELVHVQEHRSRLGEKSNWLLHKDPSPE